MTDYSLWEVIKNGNKVLKRTVGTVEHVYEPTIAKEQQDKRNEMKARATLLSLGEPKATRMSLELVDRSIQYPRGIIENVLIKVDKFILLIDFVILDMPEYSRVPIILGRPFLTTARAMIDVFDKKITLRVGDDEEPDSFLSRGLKKSIDQSDLEGCEHIECKTNNDFDSYEPIWRIASINTPYLVVQETAKPIKVERKHLYSASANEIDKTKPELKDLPRYLKYAYLHGFDIEIKDKRGVENLAADHLSRLENPELGTFTEEEITDEFLDKHLMVLRIELNNDEPWYADYVNYLVGKIMPLNWIAEKRRRFFSQMKNYFWDEPYAFKLCPDNIMRRCVARNENFEILAHCHSGPTGGHYSASVTGRKVYESGFFWPSIFKDAKDYVMRCDACQRSGNIS
ncbi:reverse transcriptase domain-containing protein [Tanacetum coccineum]